ncbi:MAG: CRISPR-associated protein Csx20 [Candidatus Hodarchaeales archaeon]
MQKKTLEVSEILDAPLEIKRQWSDVPPKLKSLKIFLNPFYEWVEKNSEQGDFILIQGDFGATFIMVNFSFSLGLIPIYSTTERIVESEVGDKGEVQMRRIFKHSFFRKYE